MNLHEYQAKQLFAKFELPVPAGKVARSADEAAGAAADLGGNSWMVKAQVHAGGRGKGGGIRKTASIEAVRAEAAALLGSRLLTPQTDAKGQPVNAVLIEPMTDIAREMYLALLVDRATRRVTVMASTAGGMNIEEVAATTPERIITIAIDPAAGLQGFHARRIAFELELGGDLMLQFSRLLDNLVRLFIATDASLIEINPLVVTASGELMALDAKITLDDNALFRHPDLEALRDLSQEDEKEAVARSHELNYITLNGDIACMVNGAGLAMATMDIIKLHGGEPANFLDVGGTATAERVKEAFKLILAGDTVRAILVNIFGGIVRCDLIAEGIIQAVNEVGIEVPVVVRLEGTNAETGRKLLADSGLAITTADDLADAAHQVVAAAGA